MLYTDTLFLFLFALVCLITRLLRPWPVVKEWFLIAFSLFVIASWGNYGLILFLVIVLVNFGLVAAMVRAEQKPAKIILLIASVLDIGTLAVFKYSNFLGATLGSVFGLKIPQFPLGIPLAISFYVFHLISYLIDIHKKRVHVATFRQYLFYLSFFPHVIAGPIVRAWQLVHQIGKTRRVRADWAMGLHFLVTGFFFKAVVANNLAENLDPIWARNNGFRLTTLDHWLLIFLYYCQIYADFAGYSLMALGMARLLGYRLPANFRSPMLSASIQEFWRRWHITLSRWLRDYLYIPLGGSRVPAWRIPVNLIITMLLGGLWHGAGWGFVIWGGMHGLGLALERQFGFQNLPHRTWKRAGWWLATQVWVAIAWVFFRAPSFEEMKKVVTHLFLPTPASAVGHPFYFIHGAVSILLLCAIPVILHHLAPGFLRKIGRRRIGLALGISTAVMLVTNLVVYSPTKAFIYFKF